MIRLLGNVFLGACALVYVMHLILWVRDVRIAKRKGLPGSALEMYRYPLDESRKMRFAVTVLYLSCAIAAVVFIAIDP